MDDLIRILRNARDALSAGANPADVDAMVRSQSGGRASSYAVLNSAVAKLQQAQSGPGGAKPEAAGFGLASRATFGFLDELSGLAAAASRGGGDREQRIQKYRDAVQRARIIQEELKAQEPLADATGGLASAFAPGSAMRLGRIGGMTVPGKYPAQPGDIIKLIASAAKSGLAHSGSADPSVEGDLERNTAVRLRDGMAGGVEGLLSLITGSLTEPGYSPAPARRSLFD